MASLVYTALGLPALLLVFFASNDCRERETWRYGWGTVRTDSVTQEGSQVVKNRVAGVIRMRVQSHGLLSLSRRWGCLARKDMAGQDGHHHCHLYKGCVKNTLPSLSAQNVCGWAAS
jgi:hypothetical protein